MVYQPNKPHKWGMQAWFLANSRNTYCYNLDIYSGKRADNVDEGVGVTHATVMRMVCLTMRRQRPPHLLRQLLHIAGGPQRPVFEGIWSLWYPSCESQRCTSRHQIGKGQARQSTSLCPP